MRIAHYIIDTTIIFSEKIPHVKIVYKYYFFTIEKKFIPFCLCILFTRNHLVLFKRWVWVSDRLMLHTHNLSQTMYIMNVNLNIKYTTE